jgi:hypothetical protein
LTRVRVPTRLARELVEATVRACLTSDTSEISLLGWLLVADATTLTARRVVLALPRGHGRTH